MKLLPTVLLWVACAAAAAAQEPRLVARTDSESYEIGEWIVLHVEAEGPAGLTDLKPTGSDSLGSLEVLKVDSTTAKRDAETYRQRWAFRLIAFDSGKVYIPPIEFLYRSADDTVERVARSNPLFLTIRGVEIDPQGDIKDIKPPLDAPWRFEDILPYLIALVVLGLLAWAYYRYRRKRRAREALPLPAAPPVPPAQAALAALRELEEKRLWQHGRIKEYYSEVTEIVRRYLEGEFHILALESTSDEIMEQLRRLPEAESLLKMSRSFFTTADLVKFAKYLPSVEEHQLELRWAYELVRTMAQRSRAIPAEQAPETSHAG